MRYPIIMNGDHAAFEAEQATLTDPKERSDWPLPSFDCQDWAEAFCKIANGFGFKDSEGKPLDEGWMQTWFANALMRGYDERAAHETVAIREALEEAARKLESQNVNSTYRQALKLGAKLIRATRC